MPRLRWSMTAGSVAPCVVADWGCRGRSLGCVQRPPWEVGPSVSDVDSDMVVFPELGVTPLIDCRLLFPRLGPLWLEVCPAPRGGFDLELAKALLDVSVLPMMITPIVDPVVDSVVSPAAYPEPPLPVILVDVPVPVAASSPWPGVADSPGVLSIIPGVARWLWLWADPLPDVAVVTDNGWSWAAAPFGYDGPVFTTDGYSVWGGGGVVGLSSSA